MRKTKCFADGGAIDASEEPVAEKDIQPFTADTEPATFGAAFKQARGAGQKVFTWRGKKYTTELASNKKSTPAPASEFRDSRNPVGTPEKAPAAPMPAAPKGERLMTAAESRRVLGEASAKQSIGRGKSDMDPKKAERDRVTRGGEDSSVGRTSGLDVDLDPKKAERERLMAKTGYKRGGAVKRGYGKARCR